MSRAVPRVLLIGALLAAVAACGGQASPDTAARPRTRSDLITYDELTRVQYANAYDLVNSLRPHWLRTRGATTIEGPQPVIQVVLDDVRLGGVASLRNVPTSGITFVQWFDGLSATSRWGPDFQLGAIYISTRSR